MATVHANKLPTAKPKKTPEQRAADRVAKKEREDQLKAQMAAEQAKYASEYMAALPLKMFGLMAKVNDRYDVRYKVDGRPHDSQNLLRVTFTFDEATDRHVDRTLYEDTVTVYLDRYSQNNEFEVEKVERLMTERDEFYAEVTRMRNVAKDAYNALTPEQRVALGVNKPF